MTISFEEKYKTDNCYWGLRPSDLIVQAVKRSQGGSALDLGAGEGRNALFLAEHGFAVTAVDASPTGLEKLVDAARRQGLGVTTQVADISAFEFDRDYNLVTAIAVLHFMVEDVSKEVIKRMKEHTKPNGLNVISVFTEDNPFKGFPNLFKKSELLMAYTDWWT